MRAESQLQTLFGRASHRVFVVVNEVADPDLTNLPFFTKLRFAEGAARSCNGDASGPYVAREIKPGQTISYTYHKDERVTLRHSSVTHEFEPVEPNQ